MAGFLKESLNFLPCRRAMQLKFLYEKEDCARVLVNYIVQAVETYWKHSLYLAGRVGDFLLSHITRLMQQMFLVGQVTKVLQMFVWVGTNLENKLWFSFLWLLQWFCPLYYLCFLWLWHLQLQHKLSGNKPLLQVKLSGTGRVLCLHHWRLSRNDRMGWQS